MHACEVHVQELANLRAHAELRLALPTDPITDEGTPGERHVHARAEERGPVPVGRATVVTPTPDALPRFQLASVGLLQPVLHVHDSCLALGQELLLPSRLFILRPARGRIWNLVRRSLHKVRVGLKVILIARALQVPKHAPCGVVVGFLLGITRHASESVGDAKKHHLDHGRISSVLGYAIPARMLGELRTKPGAHVVKSLHWPLAELRRGVAAAVAVGADLAHVVV
mmetsp:Transcript_5349/g.13330  ORF Transcript_5349/g.13330 Transcript_5349/m.13330 type:complete len:227 (+) Transcript_5349:118-798(+)